MIRCGSLQDLLVVVNQELQGAVLRVHVAHLALITHVAHECWRKDDREVAGVHEILCVAGGDAGEMENDELEDVAVGRGEVVNDVFEGADAVGFGLHHCERLENERVLLDRGGDHTG